MPDRKKMVLPLAVAMAALIAPISVSIVLAWHETVSAEKARGLGYAREVMRRVNKTAAQFANALRILEQPGLVPCSPADIDAMRQIDLGSSYIQAVGRISGDTLLCSSQGVTHPDHLGKPDLVTDGDVEERLNRRILPEPWQPVNIYSKDGVAVFTSPSLPVDISNESPEIEIALFVPSSPNRERIELVGGDFRPEWFQPIPKGAEQSFIDNGYVVTAVRSADYDVEVVIATPEAYIYRRVWRFVMFLAPIGLLCGVGLAWAGQHVLRTYTAFPALVRAGIKKRQFFVEYQPILSLETWRCVGAEALVRWNRSGVIDRPDLFIPVAEEFGVIQLITAQVVAQVGRDMPRMMEIDPELQVSINMSAGDLRSGQVLPMLEELLRTSGARACNFEIEATERAFLHGAETAALIGTLRQMGFGVAMDDFGTGYSSLAAVQSLSLDTLKIDKAFVDTIGTDGPTSQVVQHIIEMAHSLKLHIVAEGVETAAQAEYLRQRGVQRAQGWLFGRPMSIGKLCEWLKGQKNRSMAPVA